MGCFHSASFWRGLTDRIPKNADYPRVLISGIRPAQPLSYSDSFKIKPKDRAISRVFMGSLAQGRQADHQDTGPRPPCRQAEQGNVRLVQLHDGKLAPGFSHLSTSSRGPNRTNSVRSDLIHGSVRQPGSASQWLSWPPMPRIPSVALLLPKLPDGDQQERLLRRGNCGWNDSEPMLQRSSLQDN